MAEFVKGDVVVVPFPFSDLSQAKRRPALVLADVGGADLMLCQITSQTVRDQHAVPLADHDFEDGSLRQPSNIRPNRIFTADRSIIQYKAGHIRRAKMDEVVKKIIEIVQRG